MLSEQQIPETLYFVLSQSRNEGYFRRNPSPRYCSNSTTIVERHYPSSESHSHLHLKQLLHIRVLATPQFLLLIRRWHSRCSESLPWQSRKRSPHRHYPTLRWRHPQRTSTSIRGVPVRSCPYHSAQQYCRRVGAGWKIRAHNCCR